MWQDYLKHTTHCFDYCKSKKKQSSYLFFLLIILLIILYSLQKVKMVKLEVKIVHKRNQPTFNKFDVRLSLDTWVEKPEIQSPHTHTHITMMEDYY